MKDKAHSISYFFEAELVVGIDNNSGVGLTVFMQEVHAQILDILHKDYLFLHEEIGVLRHSLVNLRSAGSFSAIDRSNPSEVCILEVLVGLLEVQPGGFHVVACHLCVKLSTRFKFKWLIRIIYDHYYHFLFEGFWGRLAFLMIEALMH